MKPIHLTMTAFGSYAGRTEVPFDKLTGGLYLIVGKTGAGKTTIFDAICFALFGVPSGTDRRPEMLHSDYVERSVDTEVTLIFQQGGKRFEVRRTIHFPKKRGEVNAYGDPQYAATMLGEDGLALEGASRVTERCETLLGLNVDQFRRIVMLAQGEFREFLKANSDKKNEILGRLFDNSEYLRFQNLLGGTRDALRKRREQTQQALRTVMETLFVLPEGEPDPERFLPEHPDLPEALADLTKREEAALEAGKAAQAECQTTLDALTRREVAARNDNALLDRCAAQRQKTSALEARREETEALQRRCDAAERALYRVRPQAEAADRARTVRDESLRQTEALRQEYAGLLAAVQTAEEAVTKDRAAAGELDALTAQIAALEQALARFVEAEAAEKERETLELIAADAKEKADAARQAVDTQTTLLRSVREELTALAGVDAEVVRQEAALTAAKERWNAFVRPENGLAARIRETLDRETALGSKQTELASLTQTALAAVDSYRQTYRAWIAGQAGLLGAKLEKTLDRRGEAACPVCNTVFTRGQPHRFAVPPAQTPTEQDVEAAKVAAESAEEGRKQCAAAVEAEQTILLERRERLLSEAAAYTDEPCWETLATEASLQSIAGTLRTARQTAANALRAAQERQTRAAELTKTQQTAEQTLQVRTADADRLAREQTEADRALAEQSARVAVLRAQLPALDRASVQSRTDVLTAQRQTRREETEQHRNALQALRERSNRTAGRLQALEAALPDQEAQLAKAETAFHSALREAAFADEFAYTAALALPEGKDLAAVREEISAYYQELAAAQEQKNDLEVQTKDLTYMDLAQLEIEVSTAKQTLSAAITEVQRQQTVLDRHRQVLDQVTACRAAMSATETAWERIDRLAELALGANAEGGRLSFDRYVMVTIFREVLDMANRRLDLMTGGRFQLVHAVEAERKNASAGLEIRVLDAARGKERSAASVSGGESFLVSLALALGLSDVVQNHAGGQKLDTLFIDEGFGSLDEGKLDNVITVLQQLTEGNRLVGLISHVDKLEESIPQKLRVRTTDAGSELRLELS